MNTVSLLLNHFVPREENGHRAHLLQITGLFFIILFSIFSQISLSFVESTGSILGYAANISTTEVVNLTNQKRASIGLNQLSISTELTAAAKAKGEHMLANDYWAHVAPDGTEPWKFFCDANYCNYRYAGENLARDFTNASSAVEAWMASPSHKENLLSEKYTEIGIAVVEGDLSGSDTTIIVQLFGTRLSGGPQIPQDESIAAATAPEVPAPTVVPATTPSPRPTISAFPVPSPTPVPVPTFIAEATPVGGPTTFNTPFPVEGGGVLISPFNVRRGISFGVAGLLVGVFVIDALVIHRRKLNRNVGRTFAHLSYLAMIVAVLLILKSGEII